MKYDLRSKLKTVKKSGKAFSKRVAGDVSNIASDTKGELGQINLKKKSPFF